MNKKTKILLLTFLIVALCQLWFPFSMVSKYNSILKNGDIVKMKLAPYDPVHPFQGKYLHLTFRDNRFVVKPEKWKRNENVYIHYHTDKLN